MILKTSTLIICLTLISCGSLSAQDTNSVDKQIVMYPLRNDKKWGKDTSNLLFATFKIESKLLAKLQFSGEKEPTERDEYGPPLLPSEPIVTDTWTGFSFSVENSTRYRYELAILDYETNEELGRIQFSTSVYPYSFKFFKKVQKKLKNIHISSSKLPSN